MKTPPYFIYPMIERLRREPDGPEAETLRLKIAANVGDTEALYSLIGEQSPGVVIQSQSSPTAESTIDAFIEKFSRPSRHPGRMAPAPSATDYFSSGVAQLEPEEEPAIEEHASGTTDYEEAMAEVKNLVKNGEYERAVAIMEEIYLNNPKKSVYFADQMRFVKKLMELKRDKKQ